VAQTVYLSVRQVADRLGVSTDSIYRWKRHGEFPAAVKLGPGSIRWRLTDVEAWEQSRITCFAISFSGFDYDAAGKFTS
jgi:excisionase family DNA binding protein